MQMDLKQEHIINTKTVLFRGFYYEHGELFTKMIEGDEQFLIAMTPLELIDHSLLKYGSDFHGALRSAKELLGKSKKMYPIQINGTLDIWLFPTKSYKQQNCIWFGLNHIKDCKPLSVNRTKVSLSYGHTIEIEMREQAFKNKRNNAKELREKIVNNSNHPFNFLYEPKKGFCLFEEKKENSYHSKKDKQ